MTGLEEDDVVLRLLHTADWHIGRSFPSFDEDDERKLTRARVAVLDRIIGKADYHRVDAILCAGDLFERPNPEQPWWKEVARALSAGRRGRPIFLLPGNHDPLQDGSVYSPDHPFRAALPSWVHVVDRDDFVFPLNDASVLYARPCRSQAGQEDPALALPNREPGDERIRIGLCHGSTFDAPNCQVNFPIARDAAERRGLDYLAIGDTHSSRNVSPRGVAPVVYPGAPEPMTFHEPGAGNVVLVFVSRSRRVDHRAERVAHWSWRNRTVQSLDELRDLAAEPDLDATVLRLTGDLSLTAPERTEAEELLVQLKGTAAAHGLVGILQDDGLHMELDASDIESQLADLPDVLRTAVERLKEHLSGERPEVARAALYHLYRLAGRAEAR